MPALRNKMASTLAGGPRQFAELRDKIIISVSDPDAVGDVDAELDRVDMRVDALRNAPVLVAEPRDKVEDVIDRIAKLEGGTKMRQAVDEVTGSDDEIIDITSATISATRRLSERIEGIPGVGQSNFAMTYTDFGPENLRMTVQEMTDIDISEAGSEPKTLGELNSKLGLDEVWEEERGDMATVAIFDTGFAEGVISNSRIVDTFHAGGTDSVYAPAEGHGTMCAGAAAANKDEGVPFNGAAPDADVILVRITDSEGQIRSDIISKGWDYLMSNNSDKPIVANHSYGTPICSGRPRQRHCGTPEQQVIKIANSDSDITSVYAAGNEAMQCGHRPSGLTNAVTGTNSLAEVITVGALRYDGREAQRYSSHGRGDCAPIADPKPNVTCALPMKCYYGEEGGWKIKDMSMGIGGSGGGTSHASPTTSGMIALIQSKAVKERGEPLQTEELKQILHNTSEVPRRTQINTFGVLLSKKGYDARFGHGQVMIDKALQEV